MSHEASNKKIGKDAELDFLWSYFEAHAKQRLATFNFFLALLSATLVATFKDGVSLGRFVGGMCLLAFALVFWMLDRRNHFLIKGSERALKSFEKKYVKDARLRVFTNEERRTNRYRRRTIMWSYRFCFRFVFAITGVLGGSLSIISVTGSLPALVLKLDARVHPVAQAICKSANREVASIIDKCTEK